jgi:hypothetical protein
MTRYAGRRYRRGHADNWCATRRWSQMDRNAILSVWKTAAMHGVPRSNTTLSDRPFPATSARADLVVERYPSDWRAQ